MVRKNLLIKVLEEYDNSSHAKIGYLIKTANGGKSGYRISDPLCGKYLENLR